jgi:Acyclic terpene utilisation family protein AtuA
MMAALMKPDELRIVALNGALGYGYDFESLEAGLALSPHMVGGDAGSTDAGPYYLGTGTTMIRAEQVYRDLRRALVRARANKTPVVIGSAGLAGAAPNVRLTLDILTRIARDEQLHFRLALIHADIPNEVVTRACRDGRIEPMPGCGPLDERTVRECSHIVGQMGTEPFIAAIEGGADVILAGRACDTAIYAALPILRGYDPGLALHMAKIMECGAQCAIPLAPNDSLLGVIRRDHFLIRPLATHRRCTPESVAAHTMYEQPSPFILNEPEGVVDVSESVFEQVDEQTVRVSGAIFRPQSGKTRIKLEGARRVGFRAFTIAGIRDTNVIANLDLIERGVRAAVRRNLDQAVKDGEYAIHFRFYGRDAVLGELEPSVGHPLPREVGVLIEAVAQTQELASYVLSLTRSSFLHCPFEGRKTTAGNLAFPFSPSDYAGGEIYEFGVYHLMVVDDQNALFPIEYINF